MAKFGELIKSDLPILLDFYTDWNESSSSMHPVLRDVAAAIGDEGKGRGQSGTGNAFKKT